MKLAKENVKTQEGKFSITIPWHWDHCGDRGDRGDARR